MDLPPLVRFAAWLQITFGLLATFGIWLAVLFHPASSLQTLLLSLSVVIALPALVGGVLLRMGNRWAPLIVSIVARLELLVLPVGTVVGACTMWALWRATRTPSGAGDDGEVDPYAHPAPRRDPPATARPLLELLPEPTRTAPLLAVITAVGAAFGIVLAIGFHVSGDPVPPDVDAILLPAIAVLSTTAVVSFRVMRQNRANRTQPR